MDIERPVRFGQKSKFKEILISIVRHLLFNRSIHGFEPHQTSAWCRRESRGDSVMALDFFVAVAMVLPVWKCRLSKNHLALVPIGVATVESKEPTATLPPGTSLASFVRSKLAPSATCQVHYLPRRRVPKTPPEQ